MITDNENEKRMGVVKVSLPLLEALFGNKCKVEWVALEHDDANMGTISVTVSGHETLPVYKGSGAVPRVECQMHRDNLTGEIWPHFKPAA